MDGRRCAARSCDAGSAPPELVVVVTAAQRELAGWLLTMSPVAIPLIVLARGGVEEMLPPPTRSGLAVAPPRAGWVRLILQLSAG